MVSFYKFFEGWFFEPGKVELDDFVLDFYLRRPPGATYWEHLISWWEQRDNGEVRLLSYEQMKKAPAQTVRRVAAFCDNELDDELLELTLLHTSLDYMKTHRQQFDLIHTRHFLFRNFADTNQFVGAAAQSAPGKPPCCGNKLMSSHI